MSTLRAKGLGLAAISYDPPEILAAFSRDRAIAFPLLSDPGSATIKAFGILNTIPEQALGPNGQDPDVKRDAQKYVSVNGPRANMIGMAFPGTFMLDRQGRVTSRSFEDFYVERSTSSSVMMRLGASRTVPGRKISTAHLDVTTYASDEAIAPGNRFALGLDVVPRRGMHLYAPGASGYRVTALTIEPQPFVRALPLQYPPSQIYLFKPLNERVPTYQKPFTLLQEIVLEGSPPAQAAMRGKSDVAFTGALEYQACDDRICYNPESIPLSWMLTLRGLVTERPTVKR